MVECWSVGTELRVRPLSSPPLLSLAVLPSLVAHLISSNRLLVHSQSREPHHIQISDGHFVAPLVRLHCTQPPIERRRAISPAVYHLPQLERCPLLLPLLPLNKWQ